MCLIKSLLNDAKLAALKECDKDAKPRAYEVTLHDKAKMGKVTKEHRAKELIS